jgi:hypothetical protein
MRPPRGRRRAPPPGGQARLVCAERRGRGYVGGNIVSPHD